MNIIIFIFVFIFGLIIGSFLNCLIWRVYKKIPLSPFIKGAVNRSYCPKCKKQIAWHDNVPVFSFCLLGGKCRHCGRSISFQYPLVELITGILFLISWQHELGIMNYESGFLNLDSIIHNSLFIIQILRDWFLISVMIVVFVIDLRWYLILDTVVLPASVVIFILNLILYFNPPYPLYQGGFISWQNMLISGIIGGSFFLIQFLISKGKWIGGGDIRLGLLMGLALGWPNILAAIILAYFIGSIVGIGLILAGKKKWGGEVPLGTFLAFTTIIVLFWGEKLINWYSQAILF